MGNQPTTPLLEQALGGSAKYRTPQKVTLARTPVFSAFCSMHQQNSPEPFVASRVAVSVNVVYTLAEITVVQTYHNHSDSTIDGVFEFSVGSDGVLASLTAAIDGKEIPSLNQTQIELSDAQDLTNSNPSGPTDTLPTDTIEQSNTFQQLIGQIPPTKSVEVRFRFIVSLLASPQGWLLTIPTSLFPKDGEYLSTIQGRLDVGEDAKIDILSKHDLTADCTGFSYSQAAAASGISSDMVFAIQSKWMTPLKETNAESSPTTDSSLPMDHAQDFDSAGLLSGLLNKSWFDEQSLYHKTQVLKFAKLLALFSGVHQSELALYCNLYSTTTSIVTAILVATHLEELMRVKAVLASRLTEVGFGASLFRFFDMPTTGRKSAPASSQLLEFVNRECENCDRLFSNNFSDAESTPSSASPEMEASKIDEIVHLTLTTFLSFAQQYFTENHAGINPALSSNDIKVIFPLIKDPLLSRPALMVLSALATGDKHGQSFLLKETMALLNHSELQLTLSRSVNDPKRAEHLSLYMDVLGTIKYVISQNPILKESLRNNGGFTWLLANIKIALSAWMPEDSSTNSEPPNSSISTSRGPNVAPSPHLFLVLTELIKTLGHCLKGNFASKEGFNWGWYTLNDLFAASTKLYEDPSLVVGLAEALLAATTVSGWPAACTKHQIVAKGTWSPCLAAPASEAITSASAFMLQVQRQMQAEQRLHREAIHQQVESAPLTQSLAFVRKNLSECQACRDSLLIELPQAFKLIIDHLGRYTELSTGVSTAALEAMEPSIDSHSTNAEQNMQAPNVAEATSSETNPAPSMPNPAPRPVYANKDDVETAYIVILKSCKLLLDGNPANARILSSVGTCLHILTNLKALLLLENVTSFASSRQPLLLQLVEKIATYSISLAEFHKFIELLRVPTCPINFLQTLTTIASRTISDNFSPQAFITIPKTKDALVRSPSTHRLFSECKWPPKPGYTVNFWFSIDSIPDYTSAADLTSSGQAAIQDLVRLWSIEAVQDRKAVSIEALLTTRGHLRLRSSTDPDGIVFQGFQFASKTWYSVTIAHARGPAAPKGSTKATSVLSVWVNAVLIGNGHWNLPDSISTSNISITFGTSSRSYQPLFASQPISHSPILSSSQHIGNSSLSPTCSSAWHLGNAIVFDIPIQSEAELLGLYMLGPNYTGGFSGINLQDFAVHSLLNPNFVSRSSSETTQLLLMPERINLHPLHEHIFYFLSSSEQLVACRPDSAPKASLKSRSGDLEAFAVELVGSDVTLATRLSVSDVIQYAGGYSTLLYYFATAHHPEQQKLALTMFVAMTSWHAQNAKELRDNHGYLLIARVIRKLEWVIDEELLSIVFSLVGISMSSKRNSFSEGVIHNIDAFYALLLDWKVWKHAPNRIKLLLFKSLADLVSISEHAAFNAWYLRQAGARTIILLLLEDPLLPYQLAQYAITVVAYLMADPWTPRDMNAVLRYMIATHPIDTTKSTPSFGLQSPAPTTTDCPLGVAHKLVSFSGIQSHSMPVRFEMPGTEDSEDFAFVDEEDEASQAGSDQTHPRISQGTKRASTARLYPGDITFSQDPDTGPIRDLLLSLVLEMLQKASSSTVYTFFSDICVKEVLLTLLQTDFLSSRILLLKILEVYIKHPVLAANFGPVDMSKPPTKGGNCYRILGEILRRYEAADDILSILFSMLFGKPMSYHVLKTTGVPREASGQAMYQIDHPELVSTLLTVITACGTELSKKHSVIQIIYDITLHSDHAKAGFLHNGLIDQLCSQFVFELEHRIGRISSSFSSLKSKPSPNDDDESASSKKTGDFEPQSIRLKAGIAPGSPAASLTRDPATPTKQGAPHSHDGNQFTENDNDDADDPYNYTIETDVLRFLRTIIISKVQDGDATLSYLQQVLGAIRSLPLPLAYINALQKQVAYEVLELLYSFDFSAQPLYEKMQKICTFVVNLVVYQERHSTPSTSKAYQLSRYSSVNLLSRSPSTTRVGGVTPTPSPAPEIPISLVSHPNSLNALSSSGSVPRKPVRKVSFWEILDSFDSPRDDIPRSPTKIPKVQSNSSMAITTAAPSSSNEKGEIEKNSDIDADEHSSSLRASDTDQDLSRGSQASPEDLSSSAINSGSETDGATSYASPRGAVPNSDMTSSPMVDLTTEEFSIVTRRAWSSGDFLIDDKRLVELVFKVFHREVEHRKATTSAFKKLSEALRHKMVGVTSLTDIETNVSWHVERLLFHIIKDRPIVSPKLVEFALGQVSTLAIPGAFLSETEFLSRFMKYSSRLLGGTSATWISSTKQPMSSTPELAAATLACWKNLISSTASRVMSKIVTSDTLKLIQDSDGSNPILPASIHWSDGLHERIQRVENLDVLLRREWSKLYKGFVDDYISLSTTFARQIRDATRKISDNYLKKVEGLLKPSLKMIERSMQAEKYIRSTWKEILSTVTHERAAWPIQRSLLRWELDPTEGPLRTRLRLMPVYAHHHPIIGGEGYRREKYSHDPKDVYLTTDLDAKKVELLKSLETQLNELDAASGGGLMGGGAGFANVSSSLEDETPVPSNEQVVKYFPCSHITPFHKRDGELVIGQMNAYFIDSHQFKDAEEAQRKYTSVKKHSTWPYDEIKEIHKRRHLLINNALEIFLINGRTYLLSFRTPKDRDQVYDMLIVDRKLPNFVNYESEVFISGKWTKMSITEKWRKGLVTNFEYLMHLNTLSGRTYNDLTQYPVFPYILKDYMSHILQLDNPNSFREFDLPMGAQDPQRLLKFIEKYEALLDLREDKPYFYGSHYSNVGTVLHFLIRLEPYSQYFIEFQSGRFDVPDRVFHSVGQSWDLSSSQSQSDVKELIPEFYYLPEFLRNANKFKFGSKQDGTKVDDVVLPTWAHNSARSFIRLHMEALESEYVSFHLHHWIDLIFGYRQLGDDAIVARNQFHPYTYEGNVEIAKISDPIERDAIITQINSYGQTPTQLFKVPHPKRSETYLRASNPDGIHVATHRLQVFPALPWTGVRKLHFHNGTPVALGSRQELLWPGGTQYLQWGNWDGSLRAINLKTKQVDFEARLFTSFRDRLSCVDVSKDGRVIAAGSESGLIRIWQKTTQTHINNQKHEKTISNSIATRTKSRPPAPTISPSQAVASGLVSMPTPLTTQAGVGLVTVGVSANLSTFPSPAPSERSTPTAPTPQASNSLSTSSPTTSIGTNSPIQEMPALPISSPSSASKASQGVYSASPVAATSASTKTMSLEFTPSAILSGHSVDVTCIKASSEQSIIVSGSKDGSVIVWDANRLKFVRTLLPPQPANNPVIITHIEVLMYTSEIVIIEDHLVKGTSSIVLCSVNGERIASRSCSDKVGALAVTHEKPGLARNIIITGHSNGEIKFWSAFDLSPIRTLDRTQQVPVTALCVSDDFGCLFAGHASTGVVTCHAAKPARFIS